ncbi:MAG: isoleucine--tRNA ligase [Nanoarchaeota archaeon]|nr:isoleucine--tRNA ligase [Nanoarchaeota archaeon]
MYNPVHIEKEVLKLWKEKEIFETLKKKNLKGKKFRFVDGPITANNPMGVHHAYARTLKDLYQRYKSLQGFHQRYQNGFDCHGLPVEVEVEKELGLHTKKDIEKYGVGKFIKKCKERIEKMSTLQKQSSIRLGQWMNWDDSYYTYTDNNIIHIWHFLKKCNDKGWLYKGHRVQPWCTRCGTSLSQHEVSQGYKDLTHTAVFLKFPLVGREKEFILVWTTTPWTLTSNVAAAVGPDVTYVRIKVRDEIYYISKATSTFLGGKIVEEIKGKDMLNLEYEGPFDELEAQAGIIHKIIPWDAVGESDGTGIVHIAPGCGAEDYELGKEFNLKAVAPLDENGDYVKGFGWLVGKNVKTVLEPILEDLTKKDMLLKKEKITHSYPTCWRCKEELIFRMTDAWFIKTDEIRNDMIAEAKKVFWSPELGEKLMIDWLKNMNDWNISRKRYWGLPLPIWECECGKIIVVGSDKELKVLATSGLDKLKDLHRPEIDNVIIKCPACKKDVKRIEEVGDCWLDAGIVPFSTLNYLGDKKVWKEWFPAEFITEMREQVRLWFYSMLFMSVTLEERTPYEKVLLFEKVYDEKGEEMHKSGQNVIWLDDAFEKIGADVMRWLYVRTNLTQNVMFGYSPAKLINQKLSYMVDISNYIKNSFEKKEKIKIKNIEDKWIISRLESTKKKVYINMEELKPNVAAGYLEDFIINDFSRTYIKMIRERSKEKGNEVANINYNILLDVLKLMSPFTPFITEHVYQDVFKQHEKEESIHLFDWPYANEKLIDTSLENQMSIVQKIIEAANYDRHDKKIRLKYILPKLIVSGNDEVKETVKNLKDILKSMTNVKDVVFEDKEIKYSVKINYKVAGKKFGKDIGNLDNALKEVDATGLKTMFKKGSVKIGDIKIEEEDVLFTVEEEEGKAFDGGIIILDTNVNDKLKHEWLVRELIRSVQETRKQMGLEVKNKIKLYLAKEFKDSKEIIEKGTGSKIVFEDKFEQFLDFEGKRYEFGVKK